MDKKNTFRLGSNDYQDLVVQLIDFESEKEVYFLSWKLTKLTNLKQDMLNYKK